MRVALHLDIPFLFLDFGEIYKKEVIDKMILEYKRGRTPNPDVFCNREIKFGAFWDKARELGADYIATGHYARITRAETTKLQAGRDKEKDQSYFLWTLTQEDLKHSLFPVGDMTKSQVRALARKFKLPVAEKKDSQGICFVGEVSMEEFLSHFIKTKSGRVLNLVGEEIGRHTGALLYTIGERHGFEITKGANDGPYFVVAKDMKANTITVSNREPEILLHSPTKISLAGEEWLTSRKVGAMSARIRYRGELVPVTVEKGARSTNVLFSKPERGLSLGQSIVFYLPAQAGDDELVLGGAIMDKILV